MEDNIRAYKEYNIEIIKKYAQEIIDYEGFDELELPDLITIEHVLYYNVLDKLLLGGIINE